MNRPPHLSTAVCFFMHKLYAPVTYAGELYIAKVTVEEYGSAEHGKRFYNLRGIKIDPAGGAPDANASYDTVPDTGSIHSISDLFALVKKYDDSFKPHEPSKVVHADGTPKVMYHGTSAEFNVFLPCCYQNILGKVLTKQ